MQVFGVKDYQKTFDTHEGRIVKLNSTYKINYDDVVDNSFWITVHTESWKKWELMKDAWAKDLSEKRQARTKAQIINNYTRVAIRGSLKFLGVPESYDTAFYMKYYDQINKGMADILEDIK